MAGYPPVFDELHVVSDIHMGGRKDGGDDFQIFNRGPRLGAFIRHVAERHPEGEVALVLNGDVIDSLAEDEVPSFVALDASTALRMMSHLYSDRSFAPVWEALADFVGKPRRHLIFVVGNHDIELALPVVEISIRERLAPNGGDADSRIHFATHGGGFGCRVGRARVFCTHGNELDPWNWVDHNALGQLGNAMNAGRSVPPKRWNPNAGTRMVIEVMNEVKRAYPFVDLLKPEVAAVAAVLMTLDRDTVKKVDLTSALPILRDKRRGSQVTGDLLGHRAAAWSEGPIVDATPDEVAHELLGPNLRAVWNERGAAMSEDDLLGDAEEARVGGAVPAPTSDEPTETLSAWEFVAGRVGLLSKEEGLRRALKDWLEEDRTFAVQDPGDRLYQDMGKRVGDDVSFVVTGHTHKPRAMSYPDGRHYFNCGTWIRTLRLTPQVLDDAKAFEERLWPALRVGRMSALDTAMIPGASGRDVPLLFDRTNAVRISSIGDDVVGELLNVADDGDGGVLVTLEPQSTPLRAR